MKKHIQRFLVAFLIVAGIALIAYPEVSNWLYERNASKAIEGYNEVVDNLDAEEMETQRVRAKKYNDALSGSDIEDPFLQGSGSVLPDNYLSVLDFKDGIMGHIEIPKIDVNLPIYHGSSEKELQKGVGHIENSAFPIGGESCHAILTGHRALTNAKIFTDLDQLAEGDVFYIHILDGILAYQVDQILVVEPDDTKSLRPVSGEDYVSLVTCTPYGVNSHRLIVRGTRIPYEEAKSEQESAAGAKAINWRMVIIISFMILSVLIFIVYQYKTRRKRRGN